MLIALAVVAILVLAFFWRKGAARPKADATAPATASAPASPRRYGPGRLPRHHGGL